jgi:dTDP-3-amino-3,4,6-trideoxy-alpha-D-glucose transaminase
VLPHPTIPMNDFKRQWQDTRDDTLRAVAGVAESGWYIMGTELAEFERALGSVWTLGYCAGVASGLDAIEISLKALGCKPGDLVLTTPLSAFATTLAIVKTGAIPVFVDTDPFGLIDLDLCEQLLSRRPEIRFLVPVHLYGNALNRHKLERLKQRFDLTIVEDCAQSIMAEYEGSATGTAGQCAATSFYPTKNLGAMGDAGAILTNDPSLLERIQALRDYGQSAKYRHDYIGYNSRLDELHAAILRRAFLSRLPAWTARRRQIARRYLAGMLHPGIRPIGAPAGSHSCFHLFPVTVEPERKPSLIEHLRRNSIASGEHYPRLIPEQKAMRQVPYEVAGDFPGDYPNARRIATGEVTLPLHPYMTDDEVERVIAACNAWEACQG